MAILVEKKSGNFKTMEEGLHAAVISKVIDLREQDGPYGKKRTVVARFTNAEGEEASRFYTPSLHEKATLAKDLIALDGAIPASFDIEQLVGRQVQVLVTTKTKPDGNISAKVEKLLKPKKNQNVPMPKGAVAPKANTAVSKSDEITDDDIPF